MIEFTKSYKVGDRIFSSITEAQAEELTSLLGESIISGQAVHNTVQTIIAHSDAIINILSTSASSRPKARKANGATRSKRIRACERVAATEPTPA